MKTLDEQREADERLDKLLESAQSAVEQAVDDAIEQQDQAIRRCPKCGPTMVGTQQRHVGASSLSNVSGVTYEGKFTCRNCGRTASIFPAAPAAARAVLVLVLLIAIPFVSSPVVYMIAGLASVFGMFALADLIQRRRFPIVKRP